MSTETTNTTDAARFFTPNQEALIRKSFLSGATPEEAEVLLEVARLRRLNPITKQIHFVKRSTWNRETQRSEDVWAFQVAIDGLRAIAERTGLFDGSDEPESTEDKNGLPTRSRVLVWRSDRKRPSIGVARFSEFAQFKSDGGLTKMWKDKPFLMLEKCAEALALRKAFPEALSDLLEPAELGSAVEQPALAKVATLAPMLPAAPVVSSVAIDDDAELADFSIALKSCADARTLGKVVATIGTAFGEGRLSAASREVLLAEFSTRRSALKAAAKAAADAKAAAADAGPAPVSPSAETLPAPAEESPVEIPMSGRALRDSIAADEEAEATP